MSIDRGTAPTVGPPAWDSESIDCARSEPRRQWRRGRLSAHSVESRRVCSGVEIHFAAWATPCLARSIDNRCCSLGALGMIWRRTIRLWPPHMAVIAALWLAACGGSTSHTASGSTPSPRVLTGQGTTWQVLAVADGDVSGLALDGHGHFYAVVAAHNPIVEFSLRGSVVRRWGVKGTDFGHLVQPVRVALDASGDLYVTDIGDDHVNKFSPAGKPLAQWGSAGSAAGAFNFPIGIALDSGGDIFVADVRNYRVQTLSPSGTPRASWGSQGPELGQFEGFPAGIALDSVGNAYVTEAYGSNRIHKFSPAGAFVARWGGTGGEPGQFREPRGIAIDGQGNVYVGDTANNRLQELSSDGRFMAQWPGPSAAPFPEQSEIALDGRGHVLASDGHLILMTCVDSRGCG
jgi:hypothetical protein